MPDARLDEVLAAIAATVDDLLAARAPEPLDEAASPPEAAALVRAVNRLIAFVVEIEAFMTPLARGDLSAPLPSRDNFLASPFKELHSRLSELTWQTSQIARGDYSQRIDFMGEFSTAFNAMVALLAEREQDLRSLSLVDELTGLHNRRGLTTIGEQELREAARSGAPLAVVYVDLDGMKAINDRFGHAAGDEALRDAAVLLRDTVRESDVVARVGGDEFVVLAHGDGQAAAELCRRLREAATAFNDRRERPYAVTLSLGWAESAGSDGAPLALHEVLAEADRRMYAAKQRGTITD